MINGILYKCMDKIKEYDQEELKELLLKNYDDYLMLKNRYENKKEEEEEKSTNGKLDQVSTLSPSKS